VMVAHTIVAERSHPSVGKDATSGWGNQCVEVQRSVSAGENFVPRGAEARAGELLLDAGRRLDHAGIAIAASVGQSRVQVFRKPRVAILSTGDEIVEIDATPARPRFGIRIHIRWRRRWQAAGGEAVRLAIASR